MNENVAALLPETALAAAAVLGLLAGSWLPRRRQWPVAALVAVACLVGLGAAAAPLASGRTELVFSRVFAVDAATGVGRLVVLAALLLVLCLSVETVAGQQRESEYVVLLALSATGSLAMVGAADLLMLFAGFLLTSIPAYGLTGWARDRLPLEAALKYYLLGALCGVVMLAGTTLLYAAAGATGYAELRAALPAAPHWLTALGTVGVLVGLLFKAGAVPAHFWVPDVTDGTPAPVAAYLTTLPKVGALVAAYRLVHHALPTSGVDWALLLAVVAAASMTLGNLAAFFQDSVRRLLGYSTISQVGYLLVAVAVAERSDRAQQALLFYLAGYAVTNLGAFAVVTHLPRARTLGDYRGLAAGNPALAGVLLVCLLGLVGTPPTAVFLGKLEIFTAAVDGRYTWLAALAVLNTVASLFYYLRWLVPVFRPAPEQGVGEALTPAGRWSRLAAYGAGAASLALGIAAAVTLPATTGALLP
ncbi:NADH-quinone oxidoreductase subunit N [Plantactinospora sp. WMMB334]|uniref:NADH-quinone oxidoreductase subunit N n=1 Tax=Plantactinospora sp. WMMB334 TaxID=3404119 RepID=UPI003B93C616